MQGAQTHKPLRHSPLGSNLGTAALLALGMALVALMPIPAVSFPASVGLLILLPGLQIVRWLGLYASRREGRTIILSVASGLLIMPIFLHWAGLAFGFSRPVAFAVPLLLTIALAGLNTLRPTAGRSPKPLFESRRQYVLFGVLMLVLVVGIIVPYVRGYTPAGVYPVEMGDWFKHYGVSWSIRHTGVPPVDIFFYGDPAQERMSYYYYFHLTAATLDYLHGGASSVYHSIIILVITATVSFLLVFYLLARKVLQTTGAALWSLLCVSLVGGLDVIPMIPRNLDLFKKTFPDRPITWLSYFPTDHVDNWAPAPYLRINTLYATFIWVPQHVTALLALIFGLYLFKAVSNRLRLATVAPFVLLSILGHSTWIAMIAYLCLALYALIEVRRCWQARDRREALRVLGIYALVAVCLLVISFPLVRELTSPSAPKSGIVFEIPLTRDWKALSFFRQTFPHIYAARLLDLVEQYIIELGPLLLCGLGGLWLFSRDRRPERLMPYFVLAIVLGFLSISFFASGRAWTEMGFTLNNDLGMRAIMPAQAILALFAGYSLDSLTRLNVGATGRGILKTFVGILLVLGILAFVWEVCAMGMAKYLKPPRIDAATYRAFQAMQTITDPLSVVKHRTHDNASSYQLMFGQRSPGFFPVEAAVFHPDLRQVAYQFGLSRFSYMNDLPAWSYQMFREMYADYVYVGAIDRSEDLSPEKFNNPTYFQRMYQNGEVSIYKVRDLPLDTVQARFAPAGIQYMGYIIDEEPVYPLGFQTTSPRALVTAWQLEQPVEQDYTVYVHFLGPDGQVIAQADHQLWTWAKQAEGPTSTWDKGKTYLDIVPLPVAVWQSEVPLQIGVGLWVPETGVHLEAETDELSFDASQRLLIGSYPPSMSR